MYGVGQLAKVLLLQYHDDGARLRLGMSYGMILNVLLIWCLYHVQVPMIVLLSLKCMHKSDYRSLSDSLQRVRLFNCH